MNQNQIGTIHKAARLAADLQLPKHNAALFYMHITQQRGKPTYNEFARAYEVHRCLRAVAADVRRIDPAQRDRVIGETLARAGLLGEYWPISGPGGLAAAVRAVFNRVRITELGAGVLEAKKSKADQNTVAAQVVKPPSSVEMQSE